MKNKFMIGTVLTGILLTASPVEAMGNATVTFASNNDIKVGDTFTVTMSVTDIKDTYDGIVSMGGNLSFDNTKLEYVSAKEVSAPYQFQINESYNYKLAGLDMTLENGMYDTTTVYEFTFKALEEGIAKVTLENAKLTDSQDYINTTVISKDITIEKQEQPTVKAETIIVKETKTEKETTKVEETDEVKDEVKETKTEETTKVKETKEKETIIVKVQKLFSSFVTKFKKLFR